MERRGRLRRLRVGLPASPGELLRQRRIAPPIVILIGAPGLVASLVLGMTVGVGDIQTLLVPIDEPALAGHVESHGCG